MKKIVLVFLVLLSLVAAGCGSGNQSADTQKDRQARRDLQDAKRIADELATPPVAPKSQQAETTAKKQADDASRQQALETAMKFTTAFFNDKLEEDAKDITFTSQESITIPMQIAETEFCKSRVIGYLRHEMERQGVSNYTIKWQVSLTEYMGTKAFFKYDVFANDTLYVTVEDLEMSKDQEGKWYVDLGMFYLQTGTVMNVKDRLRDFE